MLLITTPTSVVIAVTFLVLGSNHSGDLLRFTLYFKFNYVTAGSSLHRRPNPSSLFSVAAVNRPHVSRPRTGRGEGPASSGARDCQHQGGFLLVILLFSVRCFLWRFFVFVLLFILFSL